MKKLALITFAVLSFMVTKAQEQPKETSTRKIPAVDVKTLDGKTLNTSTLTNDGKPMLISFWATWCKPCIKELETFNEVYAEWQKETGVKLIAVSIDDSRRTANVGPLVDSKGWECQVLLDPNSDFKRAMGVNIPPHMFLVDGNGNIVWQHTGFTEGGEQEVHELLLQLVKTGKIEK